MNPMVNEYFAVKNADYLRDVVAPRSIRQERYLTELGLAHGTTPASRRPRVWTRVCAATRALVASIGHSGHTAQSAGSASR